MRRANRPFRYEGSGTIYDGKVRQFKISMRYLADQSETGDLASDLAASIGERRLVEHRQSRIQRRADDGGVLIFGNCDHHGIGNIRVEKFVKIRCYEGFPAQGGASRFPRGVASAGSGDYFCAGNAGLRRQVGVDRPRTETDDPEADVL
jgi:hypothetical protein